MIVTFERVISLPTNLKIITCVHILKGDIFARLSLRFVKNENEGTWDAFPSYDALLFTKNKNKIVLQTSRKIRVVYRDGSIAESTVRNWYTEKD